MIDHTPYRHWPAPPLRRAERIGAYRDKIDEDCTWHRSRCMAGERIQYVIRTEGWEKAKRVLRDPRLDEVRT